MSGGSKKFPLNLNMHDENLIVSNPRVVDMEWESTYTLATKNLNKLLQPKFVITLSILSQGNFKQGGAVETVGWDSKRNMLKLSK